MPGWGYNDRTETGGVGTMTEQSCILTVVGSPMESDCTELHTHTHACTHTHTHTNECLKTLVGTEYSLLSS